MKALELVRNRAVVRGVQVTLASGKSSNFYVDCKRVTLHGPSLKVISAAYFEFLKTQSPAPTHVAGVSVGGDPIVAGIALAATDAGLDWGALLVRKEKKSHGLAQGRAVDGVTSDQTRSVWLVEDVISTGGSSLTAAQHLREEGYPLKGILCLVDREMGGPETLSQKLGLPVHSLFKLKELI